MRSVWSNIFFFLSVDLAAMKNDHLRMDASQVTRTEKQAHVYLSN